MIKNYFKTTFHFPIQYSQLITKIKNDNLKKKE